MTLFSKNPSEKKPPHNGTPLKQPASLNDAVHVPISRLMQLEHKAKNLSLLPKQPARGVLSGRHNSRLRGRGLNFEELRHYRPGDDIRTMDWKVTNRAQSPYVRVYSEEKERSALFIVDQRQTMFFGSDVKMKSVAAAEITALGAWSILGAGDRVGGLVFNDTDICAIKPQRSRRAVHHLLHEVVNQNSLLGVGAAQDGNHQKLNTVLTDAQRLCGHDCLVVIVSDLSGWCENTVGHLRRLSEHNDIIVSFVFDHLETSLPELKQFVVSDGDMQIAVDGSSTDIKSKFSDGFKNNIDFLKSELHRCGIPVLPFNTSESIEDQFASALGIRKPLR